MQISIPIPNRPIVLLDFMLAATLCEGVDAAVVEFFSRNFLLILETVYFFACWVLDDGAGAEPEPAGAVNSLGAGCGSLLAGTAPALRSPGSESERPLSWVFVWKSVPLGSEGASGSAAPDHSVEALLSLSVNAIYRVLDAQVDKRVLLNPLEMSALKVRIVVSTVY